jgi:hypothetical protein
MKSRVAILKSLALVVTLVACVAATQDKTAIKDAAKPEMMAPQPGPEMTKLNFLVGTWNVDSEYAKSPMLPQGGKATGWYKAQPGPGGFSIVADFEANGPLGKEVGHQVLSWDPKQQSYITMTVGNFAGAVIGHARWNGENLVTESSFEMESGTMQMRATYSDIKEKSTHIEETFRVGDGPYQPLWSANATKK